MMTSILFKLLHMMGKMTAVGLRTISPQLMNQKKMSLPSLQCPSKLMKDSGPTWIVRLPLRLPHSMIRERDYFDELGQPYGSEMVALHD